MCQLTLAAIVSGLFLLDCAKFYYYIRFYTYVL